MTAHDRRGTRCGHVVAVVLAVTPLAARAHHEAIFGPQSSLVLSAPGFVSVQTFTRNLGLASSPVQETTALLSGAVTPFAFPLSFTVIAPVTYVSAQAASRTAMENVIFGTRYRYDLEALNQAFRKDGNFLMGMAALEVPSGGMDHPAFHGPFNEMFAMLGSLERGAFSGIGYGFYRLNGTDGGTKKGDNLILGGGLAWTPIDGRHLLSAQLGFSYEQYARDAVTGAVVAASGGEEILLHPTVVWGTGPVLVFAVVSVPVQRDFRAPVQQDRWRAGTGVTYMFGQ